MSIASATHAIFRCPRPSARRSVGLVAAVALALLAATGTRADEPVALAGTIVVTVPLASPDSTEQDVALRYGIEPVERRDSQVLEQRVIVYRIPDGRAPADIVRQVSADTRVTSAQLNVQYVPPTERMPDAAMASRQRDDNAPSGKAKHRTVAAASKAEPDRRRATTAPRVALTPDSAPRSLPRETAASLAPRSRVSALGGNLAWPTADEPFVGTPSSR